MAEAKDVKISIGGKTITLSGDVSEEYSSRLAEYLNGKRKSFHDDSSYWKLPEDMRAIMLQLNLADDYFKARSEIRQLQKLLEERSQDLSDLKHELVATQMKLEAASRSSATT